MATKVFLQKSNSKQSTNTSSGINVFLEGKRKLLPTQDVSDTVNLYDLYTEERESCSKIRLTCQVNPVCSNILFNRITEVVKDEGSSNVVMVNYRVGDNSVFDNVYGKPKDMAFWGGGNATYISDDPISTTNTSQKLSAVTLSNSYDSTVTFDASDVESTNMVRDTQLSNLSNGFIYHCGLNIFNNHLIRSNTFKCVCKMPEAYNNSYGAFNTIADMMRDENGNKVVEKLPFPLEANLENGAKFIPLHLYEYDDILSFQSTVDQRLLVKHDGWVGFKNTSKIKTYLDFTNGEELEIERPMMNMNAGDFVDMYPSRDLYSFVPKYNKYQKRLEKNWEYCITYPASSTTDGFEDIINARIDSLKAVYFDENTRGDNGIKQIVIYSIAKHGLKNGDYVNIYKSYGNTDEIAIANAEVNGVIDDYIFTIANTTIQLSNSWLQTDEIDKTIYQLSADKLSYSKIGSTSSEKYYIVNGEYVNFDETAQKISYKKVVNGIECNYYVRIFSKMPNFKYASGDTSNEYEIYRSRENDLPLLEQYKKKEYDLENHISRLAFAKNAYSDEIAQIVFTDDIDISNIHDNLQRPLSTLYLTIIKNNKGYKEWYGYDLASWTPNMVRTAYENIEYSHCFGKLNCAFETSDESLVNDSIVTVKKLNNIDESQSGCNVSIINQEGRNDVPSDEICYDIDVNFYGDLCCYDNYNALETQIQPMLYRFNTAQRESAIAKSNQYFSSYAYDEIEFDDYDISSNFTIKTEVENEANLKKEGYYYKPHYEIPIKTFGKLQSIFPTFLTIRSIVNIQENQYCITTLENHYLNIGDKCVIYDTNQGKYYTCITIAANGNTYKTFTCKTYDYDSGEAAILTYIENDSQIPLALLSSASQGDNLNLLTYKLFKTDNLDIPTYAKLLRDGTCRFIWRDILNNGFNESDDSVEEYPFTNGAFYINKRIDMYVKRQDPYNKYGLYSEDDLEGANVDTTTTENNYYSEEDIIC